MSFNNSRVQNPRIQLLSINRQNLNPRDKHDFLNLLVPNTGFCKAQTCPSARVVLGLVSFSTGEFWSVSLPVLLCKIKQGCISFFFLRNSLFLYLFMVFGLYFQQFCNLPF